MQDTLWYYAQGTEQYGPILEGELKHLIETGTVGPDDLVWREGMPEWTAARRVQELWSTPPPAVRPVHAPPPRPVEVPSQPKTNPLAIASLAVAVLSIGCGCPLSLIAVILGHIALNQIKQSPDQFQGKEIAYAGLGLGYITLILNVIFILLVMIGAAAGL